MSGEKNKMSIEGDLLVFVYHENGDMDEAKKLQSYLNNNNCTCTIYSQTQEPGKLVLQQLHGSVKKNQRVVFLITKATNETGLITFAVMAALEKVSLQTCMPIFIAYKGKSLTTECLKKGLLALTPQNVFVDLDQAKGLDSLLSRLKSSKYLAQDLPVGNLHHGLVYSHISGFMGYVVEELKKHLPNKCTDYEQKEKLLINRFLLVIPETCEVPLNLTTSNESACICISNAGSTVDEIDEFCFKKLHAGKDRTYKATIYKIKSDNEEYYICAQVATVLTAISQLAQNHLGKIDVGLEQQRFHLLYQQILDLKGWNDTVKLVTCKDEADIPHALFDAAKTLGKPNEEFSELQKDPTKHDKQKGRVYLRFFESESDQSVGKNGVEICLDRTVGQNGVEKRSDQMVAEDILRMLEEKHIETCTLGPGESVLESGGNHEGWVIFVLSKAALEDPYFSNNMMVNLQADIDKCKLRVMLVLNGLLISDVSTWIKWVRFFHVTEDSEKTYLNGILRTVSDTPVDISKAIPAGDVIPGLAWAYVQNYLMKTLTKTLSKQIQKYLNEQKIECGCIQKLIVVWVKSCNTETWLKTVANNKGDLNRQVDHLKGDLEPTIAEFGGQIGRPFELNVFKFTDTRDPNKNFERCFLAEYVTPMQCIRMMEEEYAGMSSAAMQEQGPRFQEMFDDIMSRKIIQDIFGENKVAMIYYDDLAVSPEKSLIDLLDGEIRDFPRVIYRENV